MEERRRRRIRPISAGTKRIDLQIRINKRDRPTLVLIDTRGSTKRHPSRNRRHSSARDHESVLGQIHPDLSILLLRLPRDSTGVAARRSHAIRVYSNRGRTVIASPPLQIPDRDLRTQIPVAARQGQVLPSGRRSTRMRVPQEFRHDRSWYANRWRTNYRH